ncbi:HNH endonuclease [Vibrio europaeus]|uniref:HNH nuclease domain-containing protein n=2 Tax=Vibrio europaeus TaxID=300876 RepID=A0AAE7ARY1_9VIBR|nr:HNH endonuclease [Vibrio europaeus]MDC5810307.1 HNH endonuclease [Vibrio europaeus]QJY35475.1 hypothetical protein HOO69_02155 [Vibrio europaeus]
MQEIKFLVNASKFYDPIKAGIDQQRSALESGQKILIPLGGTAYKQLPIKALVEPNRFLADFKNKDVTRFCSRLKALASVLRDLSLFGKYVIAHLDGTCELQKLEVEDERVLELIKKDPALAETERTAIVQARVGHGHYRDALLELEKKCRVTGTTDSCFLRASHIKPWRLSNNQERVDPNNGLLLAPHIDVLFDQGWISFDVKGQLMVSDSNIATQLTLWNIPLEFCIGNLNPAQQAYMQYHLNFIYKGVCSYSA